jgi:hypothetical protein
MTKVEATNLKKALVKKFGGRAEFEQAGRPGRYRFAVTSEKFGRMPHMKRQDEAWKIADKILKPDAALDISLILTFAPRDLAPGRSPRHAV